ncbi:uncharacterized protein LOC129804735 [Phlebotomus papatasi]|uniref:uncharacterized protein LOC129804735 n=1 Tax=Phlebotomus papatasi TaxID=29031 RepID=UPI0024836F34|nr:uncharacterized protein LOC129804735 [Phlebotomus papatasi]
MSRDMKLIRMVRENKCLYDINSNNYNNKDLKMLIWNGIAKELGMKFTRAKTRWKTFRDRYARELRNMREGGGSSDSSYPTPGWKHYNELEFLKEFIAQRPLGIQGGNGRSFKWDVSGEKKLISLVRERKRLYETKGKTYKGVKPIWEEVAKEMDKSITEVRVRWKSIRDKYVREKKMYENRPMKSPWVLYEDMEFLRDYVQIKQPAEDEETCDDNMDSNDDDMMISSVKEEEELEALEASEEADANPIPSPCPSALTTANDEPEEPLIEMEFAEVSEEPQETKPQIKKDDLTSSYLSIIENKLRRFPEQQREEVAMEVITLINKRLYSKT